MIIDREFWINIILNYSPTFCVLMKFQSFISFSAEWYFKWTHSCSGVLLSIRNKVSKYQLCIQTDSIFIGWNHSNGFNDRTYERVLKQLSTIAQIPFEIIRLASLRRALSSSASVLFESLYTKENMDDSTAPYFGHSVRSRTAILVSKLWVIVTHLYPYVKIYTQILRKKEYIQITSQNVLFILFHYNLITRISSFETT